MHARIRGRPPAAEPVVDFYNRINLIFGTVSEVCTPQSCPTMSAGRQCVAPSGARACCCRGRRAPILTVRVRRYDYAWADGKTYKKPTQMPANQYVSLLMEWIESQTNDQKLFPADDNTPFPKAFLGVAKTIFKRLFRVFAHIYYSHFDAVQNIGAEAHVNTCYKHFYYFVTEFKLVDLKEMEPLVCAIAVHGVDGRSLRHRRGRRCRPIFPLGYARMSCKPLRGSSSDSGPLATCHSIMKGTRSDAHRQLPRRRTRHAHMPGTVVAPRVPAMSRPPQLLRCTCLSRP